MKQYLVREACTSLRQCRVKLRCWTSKSFINFDVYTAGSVQQIISGKDFDRALMADKLVEETLDTNDFFDSLQHG